MKKKEHTKEHLTNKTDEIVKELKKLDPDCKILNITYEKKRSYFYVEKI
jgi:hypothetical protein